MTLVRVCHLIDANADTAYFRSISRLHDRGRFPVTIGSLAPPGPLQQAMAELGTPTFALGAEGRGHYPRAVARLVGLLRRERVGLVHAHCFDPTLLGLLAARLSRTRFVFTRHHSDHHVRAGKVWHTRVDGWCARRADAVIAVSEATRRVMSEIEGVSSTRIAVVHNGMEPLREPTQEGIDRLRGELGVGAEPVVLMVARLHEEKGHRYLFDALGPVRQRAGPVTVLLAGEGPHRPQIEADARARGVFGQVRFLGQRADVPELLGLASVVVLPSLAESFGFAGLEAMSLGRPVVAAATGGIPEVVTDGEAGLVVPAADGPALAAAVCRVLAEPGLAGRLGRQGRERARLFTFERMIRGYEGVYSDLFEERDTE